MDAKDTQLIMENMDQNGELKNLWDEHLEFERQLEKIDRKPYLSPEEKVERKRLQLAKLAGKTKIETILAQYRG
ncbi:MAG: DUF465 domain-containing protein [bacterium]|nr:DUF465 domain-containing protein [bacterium]